MKGPWPAVLLLVAGLALGWLLFRGDPELELRLDRQADSIQAVTERARQDSIARVAAERERAEAQAVADSAAAVADSLQSLPARVVVRYETLPDTASAETVRAAADSAIAHYRNLADHWQSAYLARTAEAEAARLQIVALERERDAHAARAGLLEGYRDELADRLRKKARTDKIRTARDAVLGGAVVYLVLSLSR